uniref:Proliferating cell nuclear antigen PCNA C-terminal domain-containing protein n=1 Tax=Glossina austeni TaxID=7395 RepID=A0A1A9VX84_GLOAU
MNTNRNAKFNVLLVDGADLKTAMKKKPQAPSIDKEEEAVIIELQNPVTLTFACRYLNAFTEATPLCNQVKLSMCPYIQLAISKRMYGGFKPCRASFSESKLYLKKFQGILAAKQRGKRIPQDKVINKFKTQITITDSKNEEAVCNNTFRSTIKCGLFGVEPHHVMHSALEYRKNSNNNNADLVANGFNSKLDINATNNQ